MSPRHQRSAGRHFADGHRPAPSEPDFDVEAAFDPDFDFDQAFADLDQAYEPPAPAPVRPHRSRVAFAAVVTAVALPLLVIDNLGAGAEPNDASNVKASVAESVVNAPAAITAVRAQIVVDGAPLDVAVTTTTTAAPAPVVSEVPVTTAAPATTSTTAAPTTTTTAPKPTTTTTAAPTLGDPDSTRTWEALADCESGGDWDKDTGNGYYGGLQFSQASWENVGGEGLPSEASKAAQIEMGKRLQGRQGWAAWPTCARDLGFIS
jgi:hypothetical protein